MGRLAALPDLADPQADRGALELDIRAAMARRAVRRRPSVQSRLGRTPGGSGDDA